MRRPLASALLLLVAAACDDAAPSAPSTPTAHSAEPAAAAPAPSAPATPAARAPIPEADARALFDAWLAAQNEGRFDAYAALYASRFAGVKRSGERVRRFDRAGFLEDRRRMFARPMEVRAEGLEVRTTPTTATLRFEQRWSSGTYRDAGPKELLLVREGDALRIAREEMLASRIEAPPPAEAALPLGRFFFALDAGGPLVVLHPSAEASWGRGELALDDTRDYYAVSRAADPARLPPELAALRGRMVRAYDERGEVCAARLGAPRVMRRARPHFGSVQTWRGELGGPPASAGAIAAEVWELHGPGGALVAPLDSGRCAGALFAQLEDAPPASVLPMTPAESPEHERLLSAARESAAYREAGEGRPEPGPWELLPGGAMQLLVGGAPGARSAVVELRAGEGCADFTAALFLPFEEKGGVWAPVPAPLEPYRHLASFDLEGDGRLEHLVELDVGQGRVLLRAEGDRYRPAARVEYPYLDCPC